MRLCEVDGCGRKHNSHGLCSVHDRQMRTHGVVRGIQERRAMCDVEGCGDKHRARGLCSRHYKQINLAEMGECRFDGCGRLARARSLCATHYMQYRRGDELRPIVTPTPDNWFKDKNGYITRHPIQSEGLPKGQILQHRWVMEQHLGRKLRPKENVHHLNGDRADNRIENLELWSTSQPPGQRIEDKVAWAKELLALYEPEALANRRTLRAA